MSVSRRRFLTWMGGASLGTAIGRKAYAGTQKEFKGYPDSITEAKAWRVEKQVTGSAAQAPVQTTSTQVPVESSFNEVPGSDDLPF